MEKKIPTSVLFIDVKRVGGRNTDAVDGRVEDMLVLFPSIGLSFPTVGERKE